MIYPSADKLENWGSKYAMVVLAAKRAKQIKSGAPPLIPTNSKNPITVALEEIAAGKIKCEVAENDLPVTTTGEQEIAQLLAIKHDDTDSGEPEETSASTALDNEEDFEDWEEEEEPEEEEAPFGFLDIDEDEKHNEEHNDMEALPVEEEEVKPKGKKADDEPEIDINVDEIDVNLDDIDEGEEEEESEEEK